MVSCDYSVLGEDYVTSETRVHRELVLWRKIKSLSVYVLFFHISPMELLKVEVK